MTRKFTLAHIVRLIWVPIIIDMPPMTLSEFRRLNWAFIRKTRKRLFILPIFFIVVVIINLNSDANFRHENINLFSVTLVIASIFLFYALIFYSTNKNIKKSYLNTPILTDGANIKLSDDSISLVSKSVKTEMLWPGSYRKATKSGEWYILSSGPASAYFLDTSKIVAPATAADLEALFQRKEIKVVS